MATNRDLLKEAIADAKAVKETAIANAKAALEEAFTPQLKTMFAAKLQEMEKEELEEEGFGKMNADSDEGFSQGMREKALDEYAELQPDRDIDGDGDVDAQDAAMMEIDLEELLRELEEEETAEGLYEAEEEEEESEEEEEESEEGEDEGEPLDLEDMTDEDLKSMIEDVIKDMINSGELEAGHEGEGKEEAEETGIEDEEVDLAELLREIEEMEEKETVDELFGLGKGSKEDKALAKLAKFFASDIGKSIKGASELAGLDPKSPEFKEKVGNILQTQQDVSDKMKKYFDPNDDYVTKGIKMLADFRDDLGLSQTTSPSAGKDSAAAMLGQRESMEPELAEALKTIEALKSELNEINLLNAKLLYTNKIFKAKNLNENQKVKVLSSFDKATTVGEVKMVFETLNEGIKVNKNTIKENLGSASKAMVTPNAKKPIVESNEAFLRMQKLAGII
jgi:hypothetical protein